ncbi:hypothetical protein [Stieleria tagensis]|nr:hypothetical protein [Stieleria tagensis]
MRLLTAYTFRPIDCVLGTSLCLAIHEIYTSTKTAPPDGDVNAQ